MTTKVVRIILVLLLFTSLKLYPVGLKNEINQSRIEWLKKISNDLLNSGKTSKIDSAGFVEYLVKTNDIKDYTEILFLYGYFNFLKNDYVNAVRYFLSAIQSETKEVNKQFKAEIYLQLANSYQRLFYLEKSIIYYNKILDLDEDTMLISPKSRIIMNIGNSYFELKDFEKALKNYEKAYQFARIQGDSINIIIGLLNIGTAYMGMKRYKKAEEEFYSAMSLCNRDQFIDMKGMCQFNMGELNYYLHKYQESEKYFLESIKIFSGGKLDRLLPEIYKYIVMINYENNNYKRVIEYSKNFQKEAHKYIVQEKLLRSIKSVNTVLTKIETYPGARNILYSNMQILDTVLFNEIAAKKSLTESLGQLAELESNYQKLNELNKAKDKRLKSLYYIIGFAFLILAFISTALLLLNRAKNKIKHQNELINSQFDDICLKNSQNALLMQQKEQQTEEILTQNEKLAIYQDKLEKLIEERTNELSLALIKAQESDNLKTYFLQNISHEIRTPLNAISGFSQLLAMDNSKNIEYIEIINQSVSDLLKIVDNIIIYSKLQTNQLPITLKRFAIEKVYTQLLYDAEQIRKKYEVKEIQLVCKNQIPKESCMESDFTFISKILIQLIENAYKYTEKGKIIVESQLKNNMISFTIEDTGIGIRPDKIDFVLNTFNKIEGSGQLFRGTGIGLAIVNKMINLLNGELSIQSDYGKGTVISFCLPIHYN